MFYPQIEQPVSNTYYLFINYILSKCLIFNIYDSYVLPQNNAKQNTLPPYGKIAAGFLHTMILNQHHKSRT